MMRMFLADLAQMHTLSTTTHTHAACAMKGAHCGDLWGGMRRTYMHVACAELHPAVCTYPALYVPVIRTSRNTQLTPAMSSTNLTAPLG